MEEILLQSLEAKCSPDDPILQRIIAECTPLSDQASRAILDKPHPADTLDARLLEALAPKEHEGLQLNAFDLMLAAQYREAYTIIRDHGVDNVMTEVDQRRLSRLHFVMQPMEGFKTPSKNPSLFELCLAYKTCLLRAVLDPSETRECLDMMMLTLKCLCFRGGELREAVTLKQEVVEFFGLRSELATRLRMKELSEKDVEKRETLLPT
ncbi:MAG: hypothetical protein LQ344_003080 [Seirophora lacunosa]|nr:MAG: hypothetical protein LQ344_003080 [Seirophora lacunosa]